MRSLQNLHHHHHRAQATSMLGVRQLLTLLMLCYPGIHSRESCAQMSTSVDGRLSHVTAACWIISAATS